MCLKRIQWHIKPFNWNFSIGEWKSVCQRVDANFVFNSIQIFFLSVAAAAAAVGVEEEQRFNFGRAAMRQKFGQNEKIDTSVVYIYSVKLDNSAA